MPVGANFPSNAYRMDSNGLCWQVCAGLARAGSPSSVMHIVVPRCIKKEKAGHRFGSLVKLRTRGECAGFSLEVAERQHLEPASDLHPEDRPWAKGSVCVWEWEGQAAAWSSQERLAGRVTGVLSVQTLATTLETSVNTKRRDTSNSAGCFYGRAGVN
jgi:hypothetical protein